MAKRQKRGAGEPAEPGSVAQAGFGVGAPAEPDPAPRGCPQASPTYTVHEQWLCAFWGDGAYSKEAHVALAEGYVADGRFKAYYEAIAPGATEFLRDAVKAYCEG